MNFEKILVHTLQFEGGYANHPDDKGGETFRGVSCKNWPYWPGWLLIDKVKEQGATTAKQINAALAKNQDMAQMVKDFYYKNFWQPFLVLKAPERILGKVFDTAVNVGVGRASKFVQTVINRLDSGNTLAVDGAIGPKTWTAFGIVMDRVDGETMFLDFFALEQSSFYRRIASKNPTQEKFLKGWLRRAAWLPE